MKSQPRVKICCIKAHSELDMVVSRCVKCVGFVSDMPSGPGIIPLETIAELTASAPPTVETVLLTSRSNPEEIARHWAICRTKTIQLCRRLSARSLTHLRKLVPNVGLIGVVHVRSHAAVSHALELSNLCDSILLDTGRPYAKIPELGGTGMIHDWSISRHIVECVNSPVWLAGGLTPDNVSLAISTVRPYGIDVCSGVRSNDILDVNKLCDFLMNIGM